jgi:GT2 family glycosyltransferase
MDESLFPVLVAVATCNLEDRIAAVLAGFSAQTMRNFRIVVLDDASTDATLAAVRAHAGDLALEILATPVRLGRSRNRNRAALAVRGESILLFWDGDMVPAPDLVEKHLAFHAAALRPSALYGRVYFEGQSTLARYLNARPLENRLPHARFPLLVPGRKLLTSNFSLPVDVFLRSRGFDEHFLHWGGEDMEYGLRLAGLDVPLYYQPAAHGFHPDPGPVANFVDRHREYGRYNLPIMVGKYPELRDDMQLHRLNSLCWRALVRCLSCPVALMEHLPQVAITALIYQRYASGFLQAESDR